jgi:hypothetical protein
LPLVLGAAVGLSLAASGLVDRWPRPDGELPNTAIASVGGRHIPRSRYVELLNDLAADKNSPLTDADRQFVLGRLIDEELLILRGIELGLPESSPLIRKAIAAEVIAQVAVESDARPPEDEELRQLYESDQEFFAVPGRYRLRWWRIPAAETGSRDKAMSALRQLRMNIADEEVERLTGLKRETLLPEGMLPLSKLADYLGPDLARSVPQLEPGTYSGPIETDGSLHLLFLVDRQAAQVPTFERLRPVVEAEFRRRAGDKALRDYLAWLRERAPIAVDPEMSE